MHGLGRSPFIPEGFTDSGRRPVHLSAPKARARSRPRPQAVHVHGHVYGHGSAGHSKSAEAPGFELWRTRIGRIGRRYRRTLGVLTLKPSLVLGGTARVGYPGWAQATFEQSLLLGFASFDDVARDCGVSRRRARRAARHAQNRQAPINPIPHAPSVTSLGRMVEARPRPELAMTVNGLAS